MKKVTALTIKNSYPEKIHIKAIQDTLVGKWAVKVYLYDNGRIIKLLLESGFVFDNQVAAVNHAKAVCESIVQDKALSI